MKAALPIFLISATAGIGIYFFQKGNLKLPGAGTNLSVATEAKNTCPNTQPKVLNLAGGPGGLLATPFNEKNQRVLPAGTIPATAANVSITYDEATNTTTFLNTTCDTIFIQYKLDQPYVAQGTITEIKAGFIMESLINPGQAGSSYGKWSLLAK